MKKQTLILTLLSCVFIYVVQAKQGQTLTADEIINHANHMSLYQGTDSKGKVTITITDKQGRTRKREFNMLRKDMGNTDEDQKYYAYFLAPPDVRKMVFMVHKHTKSEKEDDRWLYMPSLDLAKRIASGDKRTSFVGSDFLYEDISGRSIHEDIHELIETTDDYYVIKNTPRKPDIVEFEYYIVFIDKTTFLPIKIEYYKTDKRLYRVIESKKIEKIEAEEDGQKVTYPTVIESVAKNLEIGSTTVMTFSNIQYNIGIEDDIFTERYLRRPPRKAMR
jgi:outer membrane lipoprotein-sorting protein